MWAHTCIGDLATIQYITINGQKLKVNLFYGASYKKG